MPNVDGGHLFLTVLAPVRMDPIAAPTPGLTYSRLAQLAQKLALIRTGKQTAASPADAEPSPFARNSLNHLARFVLVRGPNYNGKENQDALVARIKGVDPHATQPVDSFKNPYLLFAADIDAPGSEVAALRAYTDALWETMKEDLQHIFGHCVGFDKVTDAKTFNTYIRACQVETTMPFNDYWAHDELRPKPDKGGGSSGLNLAKLALKALGWAALGWLVALVVGIVCYTFWPGAPFLPDLQWVVLKVGIVLLAILAILALVVVLAMAWIRHKARQPFPTAPNSDLPSVLKSLYVQQHFTEMMIDVQGKDDAALHKRFGEFLAATRPGDLSEPTQAPGEIRAPKLGAQ